METTTNTTVNEKSKEFKKGFNIGIGIGLVALAIGMAAVGISTKALVENSVKAALDIYTAGTEQ